MRNLITRLAYSSLLAATLILVVGGCSKTDSDTIPVTTSSSKALEYYEKGLEFNDKLRAAEARDQFEMAVQEDPDFALAHLNLALVQTTAKGFFASFNKARALAESVSEGERLWIEGFEAGALNGDPVTQEARFRRIVELYPRDPRAVLLLASHYFGQQDYQRAIDEYAQVVKINPKFSAPYNQLGYAYRFLGNYELAEQSFKKYIELIPDDPNPYDSYAEMLLKVGKYDAAIKNYRKALELNPRFTFSYLGIASCLNFKNEHAKAREILEEMYQNAGDNGQRRIALSAMAISFVDEQKPEDALLKLREQFDLAAAIYDSTDMSNDLVQIGTVLTEMGRAEEALATFEQAINTLEQSSLSRLVKSQLKMANLANTAAAYLVADSVEAARSRYEEFHRAASSAKNGVQLMRAHQLAGRIAIAEKKYSSAIEHLTQASQQNPYNFFLMAQAFEGNNDPGQALASFKEVAHFNANNSMAYAFVRSKAIMKVSQLEQ